MIFTPKQVDLQQLCRPNQPNKQFLSVLNAKKTVDKLHFSPDFFMKIAKFQLFLVKNHYLIRPYQFRQHHHITLKYSRHISLCLIAYKASNPFQMSNYCNKLLTFLMQWYICFHPGWFGVEIKCTVLWIGQTDKKLLIQQSG